MKEFKKLVEFDVLNPNGFIQDFIDPDFVLVDFILGKQADKFDDNVVRAPTPYEELRFVILIVIVAVGVLLIAAICMLFKKIKPKA